MSEKDSEQLGEERASSSSQSSKIFESAWEAPFCSLPAENPKGLPALRADAEVRGMRRIWGEEYFFFM